MVVVNATCTGAVVTDGDVVEGFITGIAGDDAEGCACACVSAGRVTGAGADVEVRVGDCVVGCRGPSMTGAFVDWTADGAVDGIGAASVISDVAGMAAGASASPC